VSRLPFTSQYSKSFCGRDDCRHISISLGSNKPVTIHNLYVPSGGDEPDPKINEKFAHKLKFIDELEHWFSKDAIPKSHEGIVVGDLNIAPLEHDVWSHKDLLKVVSHTPVETTGLSRVMKAGNWIDLMRQHTPTTYRAKDWALANHGRRLDHIWSTPGLSPSCKDITILREARGWTQTSDHVPVMATFDLKI
jgi:exodeoxyribonuclease-3